MLILALALSIFISGIEGLKVVARTVGEVGEGAPFFCHVFLEVEESARFENIRIMDI